jgi:hypothetical protein
MFLDRVVDNGQPALAATSARSLPALSGWGAWKPHLPATLTGWRSERDRRGVRNAALPLRRYGGASARMMARPTSSTSVPPRLPRITMPTFRSGASPI